MTRFLSTMVIYLEAQRGQKQQVTPGRRARVTFEAPLIGDPRIEQWLKVFEDRIPKLLHQAVAMVPGEWYRDDIYELYARLLWRLDSIHALVNWEILRGRSKRVTSSGSSRTLLPNI